jgi:predicted chitinase
MIRPWSASELSRIAPGCKDWERWSRLLGVTADIYEIDTADRLCMWTATVMHESFDTQRLEESLNYPRPRASVPSGLGGFRRRMPRGLSCATRSGLRSVSTAGAWATGPRAVGILGNFADGV